MGCGTGRRSVGGTVPFRTTRRVLENISRNALFVPARGFVNFCLSVHLGHGNVLLLRVQLLEVASESMVVLHTEK